MHLELRVVQGHMPLADLALQLWWGDDRDPENPTERELSGFFAELTGARFVDGGVSAAALIETCLVMLARRKLAFLCTRLAISDVAILIQVSSPTHRISV